MSQEMLIDRGPCTRRMESSGTPLQKPKNFHVLHWTLKMIP